MAVVHSITVKYSILDDVVERSVGFDHGQQLLNAGVVGLTKSIEDGVQSIALEFELLDVAFAGGSSSTVLSLVVDTLRASFQAIRAGLLLVTLRWISQQGPTGRFTRCEARCEARLQRAARQG